MAKMFREIIVRQFTYILSSFAHFNFPLYAVLYLPFV